MVPGIALSVSCLLGLASVCSAQSDPDRGEAPDPFVEIPFDFTHNFLLQDLHTPFPSGNNVILGGVRFDIPKNVPQNIWLSDPTLSVEGEITLEIPVTGVEDVDGVNFIANTILGDPFNPRIQFQFVSFETEATETVDALPEITHCVELMGNVDIRAYLASDGLHTDSINATTTQQVFLSTNTQIRLDKIFVNLPNLFNRRSLDMIRIIDTGGPLESRVFVAGITARVGTFGNANACSAADLNRADAPNPKFEGFGESDGLLTAADFAAFTIFYQTGDLRADLNNAAAPSPIFPNYLVPDGLITPSDFAAFRNLFAEGCPPETTCLPVEEEPENED